MRRVSLVEMAHLVVDSIHVAAWVRPECWFIAVLPDFLFDAQIT